MTGNVPSGAELEAIRAEVMPVMSDLASRDLIPVEPHDVLPKTTAVEIYRAYGPVSELDEVPAPLVDEQAALHSRLNRLVGRMGMSDITEPPSVCSGAID